jgi:hypothetical protein
MFNHCTHLVVPIAFGGLGTLFGFVPVFASCSALLIGGSYYGYWKEVKPKPAARDGAS